MNTKARFVAGAMAAIVMGGALLIPVGAGASEEGRRNTALGLGALTAYLFTRGGNKVPAFIGLGATAYAYKQYDDQIRARHKRERLARYYHRHRRHRR